jgi:glycerol-3-phosphate dehydrogenase (NAD(P)+)
LLKTQPFVIVGGPMLAAEITAGKGAAAIFASPKTEVAQTVADLFASPVFATEVSNDIIGVSLAGVLKNIYAILLGIADGLELGDNEKGWLVARALAESARVAKTLGMDGDMIFSTAGLADFVATGYSAYSRNREVGDDIVKKGKCNLKGEGTASLPALIARIDGKMNQFPLLDLVKRIAIDCDPPAPAIEEYFMNRNLPR